MMEFVGIALRGSGSQSFDSRFLRIVILSTERVILKADSDFSMQIHVYSFCSDSANLVLFEQAPALPFLWLRSLLVIAPLDCVSHRRHDVCIVPTCGFLLNLGVMCCKL